MLLILKLLIHEYKGFRLASNGRQYTRPLHPLTLLQDVVTHLTNVVNAYVQITKFAFPETFLMRQTHFVVAASYF